VVGVQWRQDRIEVEVVLTRRRAPRCGGCGRIVRAVHDHRTRRVRHLDVARTRVLVVCRCARLACPACGVRTQEVPFARAGSRFTAAFEDTCAWLVRHAPQSVVAGLCASTGRRSAASAGGS
jgi:transposase